MTNALHTLCNLYHYDCFHICKDLMEGENKYEYVQPLTFRHRSFTFKF